MTTQRSRSTRALSILTAALLLASTACGSDDDSASPTTQSSETTASTAPETTPSSGPADTTPRTDAPASSAQATTTTVAAPTDPPAEECAAEDNITRFRLANSTPPASMNPLFGQASGSGYNSMVAIYGELMHFDPATGEFVPGFAESLVPNDDLTEWTLTLKEGVTFGSGNPLNTEAVKWNIDFVAAPESTSASAAQARRIASMEIISDLEMKFVLGEPYGDFPVVLGAPIGSIVDPAVAQAVGQEALNAGQAPGAGAGAYEFESWDRTVSAVVTRKAEWWGPKPCVETFEEVFFSDNQTRNDAFIKGEVEAIYLRGPTGHRLIRVSNPDGVESYSQVVNNGTNMLINHGIGGVARPGQDLRVRQAIALALDPTVVNERVLAGSGRPSKAFLDDESAYYTEAIEVPTDPEEARRLLDEAKADGYDGKLFYPSTNTPEAVDTALIYEAQLEAVGFDVELDSSYDTPGLISTILLGNHDFDIMSTALSTFDSDILGEVNKRLEPWTGFTSPEWTAAKDAVANAATLEDKKAAYAELARIYVEQIPIVTTDHHEVSVYWREDITGFEFSKAGIVLIDGIRPA